MLTPADRLYWINEWVIRQGLHVLASYEITGDGFLLVLRAEERRASIAFDGSKYGISLFERGDCVEKGISWDDAGRARIVCHLRKTRVSRL